MIFETRSRDTEMEGTMIKRIGLLTSGGDCQALNATMRGVVKGLTNSIDDLEVYGFDEFDAIGAQRGMENEVGEQRRILNTFLQLWSVILLIVLLLQLQMQ